MLLVIKRASQQQLSLGSVEYCHFNAGFAEDYLQAPIN